MSYVPGHGVLCACAVCWTEDGFDDDCDGKAIARAAEWISDCD